MPHPETPPQTTGRSKRVQIRLDLTLKQESRIHLTKANMTWQDLLVPSTCHFVEEAHRRMAGPSKPTMQTRPRQAIPPQSTPRPLSTSVELAALLGEAHSLELPIGSPTYRRWMHHCNRCGQCWVTEMVTPQCSIIVSARTGTDAARVGVVAHRLEGASCDKPPRAEETSHTPTALRGGRDDPSL
jgi:hypothetical protein